MDFSVGLFEYLISSPLKVLPLFDDTLARLLRLLWKTNEDSDQLVSQNVPSYSRAMRERGWGERETDRQRERERKSGEREGGREYLILAVGPKIAIVNFAVQ